MVVLLSDGLPLLPLALAYILVHLGLYVVVVRDKLPFRSERAIVLYHAAPFAALCAALLGLSASFGFKQALAPLVLSVCVMALYSMTFLEIWAISDGSIYFRLLCRVAATRDGATMESITALAQDGKDRRDARQSGLVALGLVRQNAGHLELTGRGSCVSTTVRVIAWFIGSD